MRASRPRFSGNVTIRPDEARGNSSTRRRGAVALVVALGLLASLFVAATASASPQARGVAANPTATASVIGGHNTTIRKYPSLAFIEGVQATSGYACSGTVVAPRVVLTAGHCVEDLESSSITEPSLIAVATGISNLRHIPTEKITQVSQVLAYPGFDPSELHGDAGLLILATPVTAPPIALATKADAALYETGDKLTVAGWGVNDRTTGHTPNELQAATLPIEETSRCEKGLRRIYTFLDPSRQLCTLDSPSLAVTPCHGDSGGPAIARRSDDSMVEVGITSMGDATCNPASPAVYTRVDQVSAWVHRWIAAVEEGAPAPRVVVPTAHLPTLTSERAEELAYLTMEEAFGEAFLHGQEQTIRCVRQGKERLKCGVTWYEGPDDYFGRVNVFYAIRHNVVLAGTHYLVHSVNDDCYFHSGDPQACQIQTKSR
jgi:secreted trypsin-like serine protease